MIDVDTFECKKDLLTICCLSYKHGKFAKNCFDSINYLKNKIEVIVLDDGSPDNTVELLNQLSSDNYDFSLSVYSQKNTGNIGLNLNRLINKASGEYITFIALDDKFTEHINTALNIIKKSKKIAFVSSKTIDLIDNKDNYIDTINNNIECNYSPKELLEKEYSCFHSFYLQGTIIRKDIVESIGGFDEDITGDDIVLRTKLFSFLCKNSDYEYVITDYSLCCYRMHENNIHKNIGRQIKIVTEYLEKYWPERTIPDTLVDWYISALNNLPFKECLLLTTINKKSSELLSNDKVIEAIKSKALIEKNEYSYGSSSHFFLNNYASEMYFKKKYFYSNLYLKLTIIVFVFFILFMSFFLFF